MTSLLNTVVEEIIGCVLVMLGEMDTVRVEVNGAGVEINGAGIETKVAGV